MMSFKKQHKAVQWRVRPSQCIELAILLSLWLFPLNPGIAETTNPVSQPINPTVTNSLRPLSTATNPPSDYFRKQKKIYRWSDKTRFVLVYIATSSFLPDWQPWHMQLVKDALANWQFALNNRVMFVFMNEPTQADVIISWWNQAQTGVEAGASGLNRLKTWGHYIAENDIYLSLHNNEGRPWTPQEMYPFALHEIGHMLGIQEHSDNPADIMAPVVSSDMHITERDIATMQRIYAARADYTNPPGVHMTQFNVAQTPMRVPPR